MKLSNEKLAAGLVGLGLLGMSQSAFSLTWEITSGKATATSSPTSGDYKFLSSNSDNAVTVSGWTETGAVDSALIDAPLDVYSMGVRIDQNDSTPEDSPNHALDNDPWDGNANGTTTTGTQNKGREALIFTFASQVYLDGISLEWAYECKYAGDGDVNSSSKSCVNTADFDVWYWQSGAVTPQNLVGKTYDAVLTNTTGGWKKLGSYNDATASASYIQLQDVNSSSAVKSTHFLLAPRLDILATNDIYVYDYIKIDALRGSVESTKGVPAPAPVALVVIGLPLLRWVRRTR
jgi:hypothetical protein